MLLNSDPVSFLVTLILLTSCLLIQRSLELTGRCEGGRRLRKGRERGPALLLLTEHAGNQCWAPEQKQQVVEPCRGICCSDSSFKVGILILYSFLLC